MYIAITGIRKSFKTVLRAMVEDGLPRLSRSGGISFPESWDAWCPNRRLGFSASFDAHQKMLRCAPEGVSGAHQTVGICASLDFGTGCDCRPGRKSNAEGPFVGPRRYSTRAGRQSGLRVCLVDVGFSSGPRNFVDLVDIVD